MAQRQGTILHLAPHPDDELIGAPAALLGLRDAGWRVVNLVSGLGRGAERRRRHEEAREACRRAGFELRVAGVPSGAAVLTAVTSVIDSVRPRILVAPSPHDAHPDHEVVGRAAVAACELRQAEGEAPPRLWLWGLWADLPFPTIAVAFGEKRMREALRCLEAHEGELRRNDYRRLVHGRAEMNASLGPERVFGFGGEAPARPGLEYVELLCEVLLVDGNWHLAAPRWLDVDDPLAERRGTGGAHRADVARNVRPVGEWLHGPSLTSTFRV
jgi:LmbE family N-acetylglucosaminyl deacetylase